MSWREGYAALIWENAKHLPDDMPLKERVAFVDGLRPNLVTSWGKKTWQAARRDYLMRYGYKPRTKAQKDRDSAVIETLPLFSD